MKKICFLEDGCSGKLPDKIRIINSAEGAYELTRDPTEADFLLQNVCAFTISEPRCKKIVGNLLYLKQVKKDEAVAIVYGCGAEVFDERIFKVAGVDFIIRDNVVERITNILGVKPVEGYHLKNSIQLVINLVPWCSKPKGSDGSGGYCKFCKMNYMKKKPYRVYTIEQIVKMVTYYGVPMLYLTGLNNCNYGCDFGDKKPKLHTLLHELEKIPSLKYIDIDGIAPSCVYPELLEELERNTKVISCQFMIQSGSDYMLKRMNIGATVKDLEMALKHLQGKRKITGVVIAYPGETLEDVKKTINLIKKWNLWNCRVQPWTDSLNTPAHGELDKLSKEVSQEHCDMVNEAVNDLANNFLHDQIGKQIRGFVTDINTKYNYPIACCAIEFEASFWLKEYSRPLKPGDYIEAEVTQVIRNQPQDAVLAAEEIK